MKKSVLVLACLILPLASIAAYSETIEGSVQGFQCVTEGKVCPVGMEDPIAAIESTFVIQTEGQNYYLVPNVNRNILVRHLNERVRVKGKVDTKYKSITADSIEIMKDGKWVVAWDQKLEQDLNQLYMRQLSR